MSPNCGASAPVFREAGMKTGFDSSGRRGLGAMGLCCFTMRESGTERLIQTTYRLLGLISFFTVGEEECRAWTITRGSNAQNAAGVIHTDLADHFIRAEVCHYDDFVKYGTMHALKEKGLLRLEGKEYPVKDGDIITVRHSG